MRIRVSLLLGATSLFLLPIASFAQTIVCSPGAGGAIVCIDPPGPAVSMPEVWGGLEYLAFFAVALTGLWALARFTSLRQKS